MPFQSCIPKPDSKLYLNAHSTRLISENPCLCTAKAGSPIPGLYLNALYINKNSGKNLAALAFSSILSLNGHVQSRNSVNSLCNILLAFLCLIPVVKIPHHFFDYLKCLIKLPLASGISMQKQENRRVKIICHYFRIPFPEGSHSNHFSKQVLLVLYALLGKQSSVQLIKIPVVILFKICQLPEPLHVIIRQIELEHFLT